MRGLRGYLREALRCPVELFDPFANLDLSGLPPADRLEVCFAGRSNVGKSSLINALTGRKVAKVGNEPAVTKAQQRIQLADDVILFDTPGMLWPKIEHETCGEHLAASGAVGRNAMDEVEVVLETIKYLRGHVPYEALLRQRFKLDDISALHDDQVLDLIARKTSAAGLSRYEVSAFAREGHRCAHNLNYWQFGDYLGIGAGAHSKLSFAHRIVRQVRYREPQLYMKQAMQAQPVTQSEEVSRVDLPFEFMLNALRLKDGFALQDYMARTGLAMTSLQKGLQEAQRLGLIDRDLARVWPTPKGFDFLSDLQGLFLPEASS